MTDPWEYLLEGGGRDDPALVLGALKLALLGGRDELDEAQLSSTAGVEVSTIRQLWRAMGFADAGPGTRAFTRADLDALRRVGAALASRGEETVIDHARVLSSLLARAADVVATSLIDDIGSYRRAGLPDADTAAAAVVQLRLLEISALLDYLFRRQLVTVLTRQLTADSQVRASAEQTAAVIFADLVGFTTLSQQLEDDDLALLVTRFQSLAFDLVARSGGRVVKTLGDEVMVVCEDIDAAVGVATALAKAYADDEFLPDVRVGMAFGPVLAVQGDYFGPTVNLASRLVGIAGPGAVVMSDDARRALDTASEFQPTELRPRRLKGIGWTVCWVVKPSSGSGVEMSEAALEGFYAALLDDDAEELYERAPCGYLSTTPDGTIIKVNETFLAWTGYQRSDLVGRRSFVDLLTGGGRIYHETHYAPMLQMQGMAREIALDIVGADGHRTPALVNAVLERDATGTPVVVRAAVFDATERREYERELLRAKQRAEESEAEARLLARTLQQTLIPPGLPMIPGLDLAAEYRPAGSGEQVGGDFYDVFQIADGDWIVLIGDVCGKGADAAVVTALARYTTRGVAVRQSEPSHILEALNAVLLRHGSERFCTVTLARLHEVADGWSVTVCSGGHPLPLLAGPGVDPAPFGRPGALLGVLDTLTLHDDEVLLRPGDRLVFYTDGVTEGRRGVEFYGEERLAAAAGGDSSAGVVVERILHEVVYFQGGAHADDIAVVVVQVA
jgi:sigma-B regulation protein RsbU (phosphoserine phosphatase)